MANAPRIDKAEQGKYEGREYLTYEEAMDYLGMKRSTLYGYITDLEITTHKFKRDRKHYLALKDVKYLEKVIAEPWLAGHDTRMPVDAGEKKEESAA